MDTVAETLINITERAEDHIVALLSERGAEPGLLRVFVAGRGCSGYQYGMEVEEREGPDDVLVAARRVKLVVDPVSAPLLQGAEIDFVEDVMGSGFVIANPNVAPSCSCGAQSADGSQRCC